MRTFHIIFKNIRFLVLAVIAIFLLTAEGLFAGDSGDKASPGVAEYSFVGRYLDTASLLKESGEYDKAGEVLKEVWPLNKEDSVARYLGRMYFLCGKSQEAFRVLNDIKNKDWISLFYLGLVYEDMGRETAAIDSYQKSVKLKENTNSAFRLAKIYQKRKDYDKAINFYSSVLDADASIRLAYYYLGQCFYEIENYKKAYKFLAKAASFYPDNENINEELLEVKNMLGSEFFAAKKTEKEEKRRQLELPLYKAEEEIPLIKIGLAAGLDDFSFFCPAGFTVNDGSNSFQGEAGETYTMTIKDKQVLLHRYQGKEEANYFSAPLKISVLFPQEEKSPFYVFDVVYGQNEFWNKQIDRAYRGSLEVMINKGKMRLINSLGIEEYLYGVLAAEIPASSPQEALSAQAVAARTISFNNFDRHKKDGFNLCADVHCQAYQGLSGETSRSNEAVKATRGEVIVYKDKPVEAFYHSNCGGCLAADAFGEVDYLAEKADSFKEELAGSPYQEELWFFEEPAAFCSFDSLGKFRWQRVYDREDFLTVFGLDLKDLKSIVIKNKGDCYHYKEIDVIFSDQKVFLKGDLEIRNYFDRLRSSAFKVELNSPDKRDGRMLIFWGGGFGHGSGLCQEGAIGMANDKYDYKDIIGHYYPGTFIKKNY